MYTSTETHVSQDFKLPENDNKTMTQHIRLWKSSHRQAAKSQTSMFKYITIILNVMVLLLLMPFCLIFLSFHGQRGPDLPGKSQGFHWNKHRTP